MPPPPTIVEGKEEYNVEQILDSRKHRGKLQYLVKWQDYGLEENTWEPKNNVTNAKQLVTAFHRKYPGRPR